MQDERSVPTTWKASRPCGGTAMTYDVRNCLIAAGSTFTAGYTADA